jgi:hypothetical protein
MANPTGLGIIARIRQTPLAGADGTELATSLLYALAYDVRGIDDFLGRTHGPSMFDNSHTTYTAAAPGVLPDAVLAAVNAGAGRFTATPDALRYLDKYYVPDGELGTPTVTLRTTRDPLVPFFHEAEFTQLVSDQNNSGRLLQRSVDRFGHCAISTSEMVDPFRALTGLGGDREQAGELKTPAARAGAWRRRDAASTFHFIDRGARDTSVAG